MTVKKLWEICHNLLQNGQHNMPVLVYYDRTNTYESPDIEVEHLVNEFAIVDGEEVKSVNALVIS